MQSATERTYLTVTLIEYEAKYPVAVVSASYPLTLKALGAYL